MRNANGKELQDRGTDTEIKDLKVKVCSAQVRFGAKVKNIRLVENSYGIDVTIDGMDVIKLKSASVKNPDSERF